MVYNASNHGVNFAPGVLSARERFLSGMCSDDPGKETATSSLSWLVAAQSFCLWLRGRGVCIRLPRPGPTLVLGCDPGQMTWPPGAPFLNPVVGISWENASEMSCILPALSTQPPGEGVGCPAPLGIPLNPRSLLETHAGDQPKPKKMVSRRHCSGFVIWKVRPPIPPPQPPDAQAAVGPHVPSKD